MKGQRDSENLVGSGGPGRVKGLLGDIVSWKERRAYQGEGHMKRK